MISALSSLKEHANPLLAQKQSAYLRDLFPFLGITKPHLNVLEKAIFKKYPLKTEKELVGHLEMLWEKEEREYQYMALSLSKKYKKLYSSSLLKTFEKMIRTKSWWDTVDDLSSNHVGVLLLSYPHLIEKMDAWIEDQNLWIRRCALIFQLKWKTKTDTKRLFHYIERTMGEKDFFMRKAIGWALREYSKTDPEAVKMFIEKHKERLSPLSLREGSKYI
jgi:3-methyladenine DNA glycosylase AlkD